MVFAPRVVAAPMIFTWLSTGNATISGVDLFLLLTPIIILLAIQLGSSILDAKLCSYWIACLVISLFLVIVTSLINPEDGLWTFKLLVGVMVAPFLSFVEFRNWFLAFLTIFTLCLLPFAYFDDQGRLYAIFGPNTLYKIGAFGAALGVFLGRAAAGYERMCCYTLACFFTYFTLMTGSAGGVLLLIIFSAILFRFRDVVFLSIILAFSLIYSFYAFDGSVESVTSFSRIAYKIVTATDSPRFIGWSELLSESDMLKFHTSDYFKYLWTERYYYPHNIFVELFAYYGVIGLLANAILVVMMSRIVVDRSIEYPLKAIVISFFVGALFSGDLTDNFVVFPLALICLRTHLNLQERCREGLL